MNLILVEAAPDGVAHLAIEGALTAVDLVGDGRDPLADLVGEDWPTRKILLDLSNANYLDSSAIGWLLTCARQLRDGGGQLALHSIPPTIRQIFDVLRISSVLPIADGEAEAVELMAAHR